MASQSNEQFWTNVEKELNTQVPFHLQFIFNFQSIPDNPEILLQFTDEDLTDIENFVRSDTYASEIPSGSDPVKYYGTSSGSHFTFSENDKQLLTRIKNLIKEKNHSFWRSTEETPDQTTEHENRNEWESSSLLKLLQSSYEANKGKDPRGNRFLNKVLKLAASYIFMLGGRLLYSFLHANLPIPGSRTLSKFINEESTPIIEGVLRVNQLKQYLECRNLKNKVWISDDLTGITSRVQYDSTTNQIVGHVLPLNSNSMPMSYSFLAKSAEDIEKYFRNNNSASYLHVFMAQPADDNAAPFCLNLFGSDNRMTTEVTLQRYQYIFKILEDNGIEVMGNSADGDTRALKSMRILAKLGDKEATKGKATALTNGKKLKIPGFHAEILPKQVCMQDAVHLGNKFKTRLFKTSIILPMGDFAATSGDIIALVGLITKDKHRLTETDLSLNDKMNFASTMRLCHPRLWALLKNHVPNSDGTQNYLKIMFLTMQATLSTELNPLQRLYCIWYGVFFVRLWRSWLSKKKGYSIVSNFISLNSYVCMELNAHGLLNLILKCLEEGKFDDFLPWLFSSQPCEGFFRNLRSTSSTFSTIVNCSVLDAIRRLQKIQLLADINVYDFKADNEAINFVRTRFLNASNEKQTKVFQEIKKIDDPVSLNNILKVLKDAKTDAWNDVQKLGMDIPLKATESLQVDFDVTTNGDLFDIIDQEDVRRYEIVEDTEIDSDEEDLEILSSSVNLNDFPEKLEGLTETSPLVAITNNRGNCKVVKKSSLCWFLDNRNKKISSDRTLRVTECEARSLNEPRSIEIETVQRLDTIFVRDFCVFKIKDSELCLIGLISGFGFMDGIKWSEVSYSKKFAVVNHTFKKKLGVFARWFTVDQNDWSLVLYPMKTQGYIDIAQYQSTIPAPVNENGKFIMSENAYRYVEPLILKTL